MQMALLWLCVALASVVFAVMLYSVVVHREARGRVRAGALLIEVLWAAVPIAIMIMAAMPMLRASLLVSPTAIAASRH